MQQKLIDDIKRIPGFRYMTEQGEMIGEAVSGVPAALRDMGWRRVSNIDSYNLKQAGFTVTKGRYMSPGGLKRECDIVVLKA